MNDFARLTGSVLCLGSPGDTPEIVAEFASLAPGGLVLFGRNVSTPERTRAFVDTVRAALDRPVSVMIDQEGGSVMRLRTLTSIPSAMAVAAAGDVAGAEMLARGVAADLRRIGADVNLAPVADLALEPASTVIGTRAYSDDPAIAAQFVGATVHGLQRGGVAATLKHFPGHGATAVDSHVALPRLDVDAWTLRRREFVPFEAGLEAGACAVMLAHLIVPALDSELPASLSPRAVITLRQELGFKGAIVTDCLQMDAIARGIGTVRAAVLALKAGVDGVMISHDLGLARAARAAIVEALASGELSPDRLEVAAQNLRRLASPASSETVDARDVAISIARGAITLVRGETVLPLYRAVNVVSFEGSIYDFVAADHRTEGSLHLALRRRRFQAESLRVPLGPSAEMIDQLRRLLEAQSDRSVVVLMRRAHIYPDQLRAIEMILETAPSSIVISLAEPFDVAVVPQAQNVLCAYGDNEPAIEGLADVLTGLLVPSGRFPVDLERALP